MLQGWRHSGCNNNAQGILWASLRAVQGDVHYMGQTRAWKVTRCKDGSSSTGAASVKTWNEARTIKCQLFNSIASHTSEPPLWLIDYQTQKTGSVPVCNSYTRYQCRPRYSDTATKKFEQIFWADEDGCSPWAVFTASVSALSEVKSIRKGWLENASRATAQYPAGLHSGSLDISPPPLTQLNYRQMTRQPSKDHDSLVNTRSCLVRHRAYYNSQPARYVILKIKIFSWVSRVSLTSLFITYSLH